jgi:hypothetical protein
MSESEGDISVMLSSALISKITQEYFNKVMFKQKVEIVDLRPASDGYMFVVAFANEMKVYPDVKMIDPMSEVPGIDFVGNGVTNSIAVVRDGQGKFAKVKGE